MPETVNLWTMKTCVAPIRAKYHPLIHLWELRATRADYDQMVAWHCADGSLSQVSRRLTRRTRRALAAIGIIRP